MQTDDVKAKVILVPEIVFVGVGQDQRGEDVFAWVDRLPDEALVNQIRAAHEAYLNAMRKKRKKDDDDKPVRVGVFSAEMLLDSAKRLAAKGERRVVGQILYGQYELNIVEIPKEETKL